MIEPMTSLRLMRLRRFQFEKMDADVDLRIAGHADSRMTKPCDRFGQEVCSKILKRIRY
jgi:hypothetical protein